MSEKEAKAVLAKPRRRRTSVAKDGPNEVDVIVGERIRQHRVLRGVSQTGLGESVGVTFQQMQKYEKGVNRVSASRLYQIAKILEIDIASLFPSEEEDSEDGLNQLQKQAVAIDRRILNLVRFYSQIANEDTRDRIYDLIRELSTASRELDQG
ncbi:helix-turn-helix domain-containing protein [Thalassospira sp. CH_XMU1420-2]|uniref:helix-turn-helix domain-containing protein n=1 Tax=Thalassospira sp. CH_XMU1420-2 TaxID=3107769 RepID=UPI00300B7EB1